MSIQFSPENYTSHEVDTAILSQCDLKTVINCSSVCTAWNEITNGQKLLCNVIPDEFHQYIFLEKFQINSKGLKAFVQDHAVDTMWELVGRFFSFLHKVEKGTLFNFTCIFPERSHSFLSVKCLEKNKEEIEYADQNIDFCFFMKSLPAGTLSSKGQVEGNLLSDVPFNMTWSVCGISDRSINELSLLQQQVMKTLRETGFLR